MATNQIGQCALCRQKKELQLSHIVPKFVGRRLKNTSPGNIRNTNEPNKIAQDIEKHFMLCHDCEELFSEKETWFASHIFNTYHDKNEKTFDYDESLTYFIISLSWRSLYLDLAEFAADPEFDKDILMTLFRSEEIMRDYLMGKRTDIGSIENHVFFLDRIQSESVLDASKNPSVAMHRSISSYTVYNGKTSFTVSNLMGIWVITFYSMDSNEHLVNTKINFGIGRIEARDQQMTSAACQEIQHWMNELENADSNLSQVQKAKIDERFEKLGDDIKKYPIYKDLMDDNNLSTSKKLETS